MNTKNNILITEFMGAKITTINPLFGPSKQMINTEGMECYVSLPKMSYISALRYDKSWDWLISVVEKIQDMGYLVNMNNVSTNINNNGGGTKLKKYFKGGYNSSHGNMKRRTYKAVVEFIKWYNLNQKHAVQKRTD